MGWRAGGAVEWGEVVVADAQAGSSVAELRVPEPQGGPYGYEGECLRSWMEAEVDGPGTFTVQVRHNFNPYTRLGLLVDGIPAEEWLLTESGVLFPGGSFSAWRRMSAAIPPGTHTVRIHHEFACWERGGLFVREPAIQADQAQVSPLASASLLEAIEAVPGDGWLVGGAVDFQLLNGVQAWDGVDALRAPAVVPVTSVLYDASGAPWLQRDVVGPVNLRWRERYQGPVDAPWITRDLFIPAGTHTFRWTAAGGGQDIDGYVEAAAPAVPLGEALDRTDLEFTQVNGMWAGVRTPAAPDGVDAAWVRVESGRNATLETEVEGPATFRFRFSTTATAESEATLMFLVDGRRMEVQRPSGTVILPAGLHRLTWDVTSGSLEPSVVLLDAIEIEPLAAVPLGEALDAPELSWTNGPIPWIGLASDAAPDGIDAAVAPTLNSEETAWIETVVTGPGRLTFDWVLDRSSPNQLRIIIDDRHVFRQNSQETSPVVEVGPGPHTFRWLATGHSDWHRPALDRIVWTPLPAAPRLLALGVLTAPVLVPDDTFATVRGDVSHDGSDSLRLFRPAGAVAGPYSSSLMTWAEGPGKLYYWWRTSSGERMFINSVETTASTVDGEWKRGVHFVPPGWRSQSWSLFKDNSSANQAEGFLDLLTFVPSTPIPLDIAQPGAGPWRTSPEAPWTGLPADAELNAASAAHAAMAASSWLETDITGPAVVVFDALGQELNWLVDGEYTGSASSRSSTPRPATVFIPRGRHTLRWHNTEAAPAMLADTSVRPLDGDLFLTVNPDTVLIRVPRPAGFSDAQILLQFSDNLEYPWRWANEYSLQVHQSDPTAVTFSVPSPLGVTRFWRAVYAPSP